jgi:hypothetical protein
MSQLQQRYNDICNEYVHKFSKKQGISFDYWVGDEVGGIASFCEQYFFNFHDISWDINSRQPKGLMLKWQEDVIENYDAEGTISYYSYSNGLRYECLDKKYLKDF